MFIKLKNKNSIYFLDLKTALINFKEEKRGDEFCLDLVISLGENNVFTIPAISTSDADEFNTKYDELVSQFENCGARGEIVIALPSYLEWRDELWRKAYNKEN